MQFNHSFYGNAFPNCGQLYPGQPPCPYPSPQLRPDVVGEGDVTTILLPDGGLQFYFHPDTSRWFSCNPTFVQDCNNPYWNNNTGVWFIRNISNPVPVFNQPIQRGYAANYFAPRCTSDCNLITPPGFQLKFHNDNCTSTTNLHYFFPCPRPQVIPNFTTVCKAIQVNTNVTCAKPCHCEHRTYEMKKVKSNETITQSETDECMCSDSVESTKSYMSVEETKQRNWRSQRKQNKYQKRQKDKSRNRSQTKVKEEKQNQHTCLCSPPPADKAVMTYNDKGCSSVAEAGCDTQDECHYNMCCELITVRGVDLPELWSPITPQSKKAMNSISSMKLRDCETDCCTDNRDCDFDSDRE